jgi:hypothetical protein
MKQLVRAVITDKRSVPFNVAGTGTIVTHGIAIVGTGTAFSTELQAGSYLVNLTTNEAIKVYRQDTDTKAFLEKAFSSDISSSTPQIISKAKAKVKEIKLVTAGACYIDGVAFTGTADYNKNGDHKSGRPNLIEPIIVDATGQSMTVEIVNY